MGAPDLRVTVPLDAAGRLDAVLAPLVPLSRSRLQAVIRDGGVVVDGAVVCRPRHALIGGERVRVTLPPEPTTSLEPEDLSVPMLHLDAHVVVVDKPAGMVVHPAKGHDSGTLVHALLHLVATHGPDATVRGRPVDPTRPGIVHRLDKGTSGVMVVARTLAAHAHLAEQFAAHTADRRYLALVWGRTPGPSGTIDAALGRHPTDRKRIAVVEGGRRAVTHWERLGEGTYGVAGDARGGVVSLVRCRLETGRTHQVRVHLTQLGLPLLGDPVYAARRKVPGSLRDTLGPVGHQLLHATRLGLTHPGTGARHDWRTPPPPDFSAVAAALELDAVLADAVAERI